MVIQILTGEAVWLTKRAPSSVASTLDQPWFLGLSRRKLL